MPGFSITSPTNTIALDRRREAQTVFAVANQTEHNVRARAAIVAQEGTDPKWFRVVGQIERDFAPGGTEAFSVAIDVPPQVPVGQYSFRVDVASVATPDEEWGH